MPELIHGLLLVLSKLAKLNHALIPIVIAKVDLVFHGLESGATFKEHHLMISLLNFVEFLPKLLGSSLEHVHDRLDSSHGRILAHGHLAGVGQLHPQL